jgi:hypothetical protein
MSDTKFGTFEELMEMTVPEIRPIARRLREIVADIDPNHVEVVRLGDRAATFGVGPKKMSEAYTYILPHNKWVNLGFFRGSLLPDPAGLLEGTGAKMRHVKIRSVAEAEQAAVRRLIEVSLAERKEALKLLLDDTR